MNRGALSKMLAVGVPGRRPPTCRPIGQAGVAEGLPHRVPLLVAVVALGREQRDVAAVQAGLRGGEADLLGRPLGRVDRDGGHPEESSGRVGRVVGQPAVVTANTVEAQHRVGRRQRTADVEHFGVDAVGVHVLDARGGIARTGPLIVELADVERELLGLLPREVVERHDRRPPTLEDAEVTFVGVLDHRGAVAKLGVEVLLPRRVGHGDVRVRRDQSVLGHCSPPCRGVS